MRTKTKSRLIREFTPYYVVGTESGIVALMVCKRCGSVILVGEDEPDWGERHIEWHEAQAKEGKR